MTKNNPYIMPIIGIAFACSLLTAVLLTWNGIDNNIDYDKIHEQLSTNQTYVDSLTCDHINNQLSATYQALTKYPEKLEKIQLDLLTIKANKHC